MSASRVSNTAVTRQSRLVLGDRHMRNAIVLAGLFAAAVLFSTAASAQTTPVSAQASPAAPANGPLVLEQIHDGLVLAPDYKVTDVDNRTGQLAGAYGGRLIDG